MAKAKELYAKYHDRLVSVYSEGFAPSHGPMIDFSRPDALVTLAMLGMAPGRWN